VFFGAESAREGKIYNKHVVAETVCVVKEGTVH